MPTPGTSSQWQLSGTGALDTSFDVDAYDIDLFETNQATIDLLKRRERLIAKEIERDGVAV